MQHNFPWFTWWYFRAVAWSTPCRKASSWLRPRSCWPGLPTPSQTTEVKICKLEPKERWWQAPPLQLWDFPSPSQTPCDAALSNTLQSWVWKNDIWYKWQGKARNWTNLKAFERIINWKKLPLVWRMPLWQDLLPLSLHVGHVNQVGLQPAVSGPSSWLLLPLKSGFAEYAWVEFLQLARPRRLHVSELRLLIEIDLCVLAKSSPYLVLNNHEIREMFRNTSFVSPHAWGQRLQHLCSQKQPGCSPSIIKTIAGQCWSTWWGSCLLPSLEQGGGCDRLTGENPVAEGYAPALWHRLQCALNSEVNIVHLIVHL